MMEHMSGYSSQRRVLISNALQYSPTTGLSHHDVSTFHLAMGSIDPLKAPEIAIGARPRSSVTSIAVGGERRRVIGLVSAPPSAWPPPPHKWGGSHLRRSVPAVAPAPR